MFKRGCCGERKLITGNATRVKKKGSISMVESFFDSEH